MSTTTTTKPHTARLSLQAPVGLPPLPRSPGTPKSPSSATDTKDVPSSHARTASAPAQRRDSATSDASTDSVTDEGDGDDYTLMGCLMHLSVSSLPPLPLEGETAGHKRGRSAGPVMARFPAPPAAPPSSALGTKEEQKRVYLGPKLSDRATGGPDAGPLIERFSCLFKDQYNCQTNPKGIVSMGVAENFLMQDECIKLFCTALDQGLRSSDLSYGDNLWGSRRLNAALAGFYNSYFNPAVRVTADHLITGNGCSAVLDQLFYSLMDEGEAVLIAAPYYTGFDRDLIPRARVRLVPVDVGLDDGAFEPTCLKAFDAKLAELKAEGIVTRAVIICNPQNPLGRTYPRRTLLEYARWAERNDVHVVSDEIYAMSVYDGAVDKGAWVEEGFTSVLSLKKEELGDDFDMARLHVVYGMSKDFCANGLRVGSLVSQNNPLLLRTMANTSMLMKISSPADIIWSHILSDPSTLTSFLHTNCARLSEAHAFVVDWFTARGVRVAYSNAGHFIWVQLGATAAAGRLARGGKGIQGEQGIRTVGEEKKVFQRLLDGGVYIAPGTAYHCSEIGWFRVTFSIARDNLLVGLGKIESILGLHPLDQANGTACSP